MTTKDMRASVEIKLDFPVELDGQRHEKLTMRRPKVRDNLVAAKSGADDFAQALTLMANLCEVPVELIHELDEVDLEKLATQRAAFTGRQGGTPQS